MKRDIKKLAASHFDALVVGGGIQGASLAWSASLSGLSVGLIEMGDFGQGTSSNSQKIIHGGLRYLQSFDLKRIRDSVRARLNFMRLSPHLVHPLSCLMPIYGNGLKGELAMRVALPAYNFLSRDRNKLSDPSKRIPNAKVISVRETNDQIPGLDQCALKGAAQWFDGCCFNTERQIIAYLKSAYNNGAEIANYVKAQKLISRRNKVVGMQVRDELSEETFDVAAKNIFICIGPWANEIHRNIVPELNFENRKFVQGINVVVRKIFPSSSAIGISGSIEKESRTYFVSPWRNRSILGTEWFHHRGNPERSKGSEEKCSRLINNFNSAYPPAKLKLDDITYIHSGYVPGMELEGKNPVLRKEPEILDAKHHNIDGLVIVIGIKFTTALNLAISALKKVFPKINFEHAITEKRLVGGEIDNFEDFTSNTKKKWEKIFTGAQTQETIQEYGSEVEAVLDLAKDFSESLSPTPSNSGSEIEKDQRILAGKVLFALKTEMPLRLSDMIYRRSGIGTLEPPAETDLQLVSQVMARELNWTEEYRNTQIHECQKIDPQFFHASNG